MADDEYENIIGEIDVIPDRDSFLPRYLTVQLLEILAGTFGNSKPLPEDILALAQSNEQFIARFRNKDLFLPLTYSIFWRENQEQTLAQNINELDQTDKYNRAALTLAIANEDFALAVEMLHKGATLLLEDKLVLEITLISMIQRDPNIIDTILDSRPEDDLSWVADYLDYLNSYIVGEPEPKTLQYHDVINPPLRYFGQVLDTLAYFNGLPSHYGFLSPSIEILDNHLENYVDEIFDQNSKDLFTIISAAFSKNNNTCKFYGNLPTDDDAAKQLSDQIISNVKAKNNNVIVLFGGWAGNSVAIAFIGTTLIFSNLGIGGNPDAGTQIFEIKNPDGIIEQMIYNLIRGLGNAASPIAILALIGNIVAPQPIYSLKQVLNPIDNCIFVNPRAIIQGILLVLDVYTREGSVTEANLATANSSIAEMYALYVDSLYKFSAADLAKYVRNHEILQNKRIECCALALDYINQHYKEPAAIARCIELKNALEFVGLGDFYVSSIDPDAQAAIQQMMIHEQEATAIRVIEQENNIAMAQNR